MSIWICLLSVFGNFKQNVLIVQTVLLKYLGRKKKPLFVILNLVEFPVKIALKKKIKIKCVFYFLIIIIIINWNL